MQYKYQKEIIINFTPTGMIPTKDMTKYAPVSPDEIVADILRASELGASMIHIHGRDDTQEPTSDPAPYAEIIMKVREKRPELILGVTTSGRKAKTFEERAAVLDLAGPLKPDMASLTLSSLNFNKQASINSPETIQQLAAKMLEKGIKPELEVFDIGMINYAKYLIKKGLLEPPYYFNLLLGNIACAQADLINVGLMLRDLPENSIWSLAGIGDFQLPINALAVVWGGGVRVGLEDNVWYNQERTQLGSNEMFLQRIKTLADTYGRPAISPLDLRKKLNLHTEAGRYGVRGK